MMSNTPTSVHAQAYYGDPFTSYRLAGTADAVPAPAGLPYVDPRINKCVGKDNTCGANKVRGQELCQGHSKQAASLAAVAANINNGV